MSANYSRAAEVRIEDPEAVTAAATAPDIRPDPSAEARLSTASEALPWVPRVMPDPLDSMAVDRKPSNRPDLAAPILGIVSVDFTPPPPPAVASAVAVLETAAPARQQTGVSPATYLRRANPRK